MKVRSVLISSDRLFSGFSTVDLVEQASTKKKYALKKITCHSIEDQKVALQEVEYMKKIQHPNVIELIDSTFKGNVRRYGLPDVKTFFLR